MRAQKLRLLAGGEGVFGGSLEAPSCTHGLHTTCTAPPPALTALLLSTTPQERQLPPALVLQLVRGRRWCRRAAQRCAH
jgi:hypothetical protein